MVQQVDIFKTCPADFLHAIVMKLQSSICTAGEYAPRAAGTHPAQDLYCTHGCPQHAPPSSSCPQKGDYVFYEGESGERMYFIKYGKLQVLVNDKVVHAFNKPRPLWRDCVAH
eukprot:6119803-Prymnesium_polylepis.1